MAIRVLHVVSYYPPATEWGGPVRSTSLLCQALVAQGVECLVLTTNTRASGELAPAPPGQASVDGVPVRYFDAVGPRRYFASPSMAADTWRRLPSFDVVHLQGLWTFPTLMGARLARWRDVPYVLSARGSLDPWALHYRAWKKQPYLWLLERRTLAGAATIHFTTAAERDLAPAWAREVPGVVVANPISLPETRAACRSQTVLCVGRLHPMKGIDILLRAFALHHARVPEARLVLAGPDEDGYGEQMRALARSLQLAECVDFVGELDRTALTRLYTEARMLVAPSHRENFGNAVAEAMAAALPVIVSDGVNLAAALAAAGAGIVAHRTPEAVADAMAHFAGDAELCRRMGLAGRELVRAQFGPAAVAREMVSVYERIVDQARRGRRCASGAGQP